MKSIRWITPRWRANWKLSGVLSARIIIGVDYHPSFQQIAWVDNGSGERGEQRLQHNEEAETFYRDLKERGVSVRIGMEAGGHTRWFERLLTELQFELWIGDAAQISNGFANRRPIAKMRNYCCGCCWEIDFHGSGDRAWRIGTCGSCFGIATGWYRCEPGP